MTHQLTRNEIMENRAGAMYEADGYAMCPTWKELLEEWEHKERPNCWTPKIAEYRKKAQATIDADEKAGVLMLHTEGERFPYEVNMPVYQCKKEGV